MEKKQICKSTWLGLKYEDEKQEEVLSSLSIYHIKYRITLVSFLLRSYRGTPKNLKSFFRKFEDFQLSYY